MKDAFRLVGSVFVLIFVIFFPIQSRTAVWEAMSAWAFSFVPALMPVFAVSPALVCEEAASVYKAIFGKFSHKLFGVSGPAFSAVTAGLLAGSPSGAICLEKLDCERGELSRAGIMASGLSPAFLSAGVGGLLGAPEIGLKIAISQTLAILSAGWLLRSAWEDEKEVIAGAPKVQTLIGGMGKAAVDIAGVLCWMALFSLISAMIGTLSGGLGKAAPPFLEIASGMGAISKLEIPLMTKGLLAAFFAGLGGLCVAFQNATRLKAVPIKRLALGKLLHATLTALYFQTLVGAPFAKTAGAGYSPIPAMIMPLAVFIAGKAIPRRRR